MTPAQPVPSTYVDDRETYGKMALLKDRQPTKTSQPAKTTQPKPKPNLTITDGWNFGIGFGLAMTIALPIILGAIGCLVWMVALILGIGIGG